MAMIPCPKCGESISEQSKFCIHCGSKFVKDVCPTCGTEIEKNAKFCANCGSQIGEAKPAPVQKVETKTEQKEEGQEVPGPFEIVEGWKQSSAFARFLCSGWFTFVDILSMFIIFGSFFFALIFGIISVVELEMKILAYVAGVIFAGSCVLFLLFIFLKSELIPWYFRFSISSWIEKQGYAPLAIARKISKISRQEDIRSPKKTNSINSYLLHPYVSIDAAFMVAVRGGKKQGIVSLILSAAFMYLSMFFVSLLEFMVISKTCLAVGAEASSNPFMPVLNLYLSFLLNPFFWAEVFLFVAYTIPHKIINSKREKSKSAWLSSVYQ